MTLANKTVLITGANRGLGKALVEEALRQGATRVYAAARQPITHADERVTSLIVDITDTAKISDAASAVPELDLLVNNAGVAEYDDVRDPAVIQRHLDVNLFGPHSMAQAFLPQLKESEGAIVNVLSVAGMAALPMIPSYSISKAAALSMSHSLRAHLANEGVRVHVVLPGPIDTDMSRDLDIPKASPESVARAIFAGVEQGEDEIFPDPLAEALAESWRSSAMKAMERENRALVAAEPLAS